MRHIVTKICRGSDLPIDARHKPLARQPAGRLPRVKGALVLAAAYLAVTLVMMQSMINLGALGSAVYPGDAELIVWTLAWANHALIDGVPLFDANIFFPATASLQYNDHLTGISLFTLPIYATTRNPVLAYNLIWLLSFVLNAQAMHALAYRHTRSHTAAATAALIFAFSFYKMLHAHGHLALIWTWLTPLSLWLLERWIERPRPMRAAAWAAVVVLEALGSWYTAVMVVLINAIAVVWWHGLAVRTQWRLRVPQFLVALVAGSLVVAPFAWQYRTLPAPDLAQVASLSVDWQSYLTPPLDTVVGRGARAGAGRPPREGLLGDPGHLRPGTGRGGGHRRGHGERAHQRPAGPGGVVLGGLAVVSHAASRHGRRPLVGRERRPHTGVDLGRTNGVSRLDRRDYGCRRRHRAARQT